MRRLAITDDDRAWWQSLGKPDTASDIVSVSLADVGATPAAPEQFAEQEIRPQLPTATYGQLFGALAIIAVMALIAWIAFRPGPPTADRQPPTTDPAAVLAAPPSAAPAPTEVPATVMAYAAPGGAQLGPIDATVPIQYRHSEHAGWGGVKWQGAVVWIEAEAEQLAGLPDLAEPTPKPTPERIYVPVEPPCDVAVNPRYVAQLDVSLDGRPLGQVTGRSCDSQDAAQADAETQAAVMRASASTPCPTWAGPPFVKPDCGK
jgi:hypothetical protein